MIVKEYIFDRHKRVIVVFENNATLLSIDVYSNEWSYPIDYEMRDKDVSIIYHRINGEELGAKWIEIVGLKTTDRIETINVRVLYDGNIDEDKIRETYCWALEKIEKKHCISIKE